MKASIGLVHLSQNALLPFVDAGCHTAGDLGIVGTYSELFNHISGKRHHSEAIGSELFGSRDDLR